MQDECDVFIIKLIQERALWWFHTWQFLRKKRWRWHMYVISIHTERLVTPQTRIVHSGDLPKFKIQTYRNINQDATMCKRHASLLWKSTKQMQNWKRHLKYEISKLSNKNTSQVLGIKKLDTFAVVCIKVTFSVCKIVCTILSIAIISCIAELTHYFQLKFVWTVCQNMPRHQLLVLLCLKAVFGCLKRIYWLLFHFMMFHFEVSPVSETF